MSVVSPPRRFRYQPEMLPSHLEAIERLTYVAHGRGVGLLIGPAGCGKTRLLRASQQRFAASGISVQWLDVTGWSGDEFPVRVASALGIGLPVVRRSELAWLWLEQYCGTIRQMGQRQAIVIDHLDRRQAGGEWVIDRLLSLCHGSIPCLLAARPSLQPELQRVLRRHCGLRIELPLLSDREARTYLEGCVRGATAPVFSAQALKAIQSVAHGRLRSIDRLAQLAFEAVEDAESSTIDDELIREAAAELRL